MAVSLEEDCGRRAQSDPGIACGWSVLILLARPPDLHDALREAGVPSLMEECVGWLFLLSQEGGGVGLKAQTSPSSLQMVSTLHCPMALHQSRCPRALDVPRGLKLEKPARPRLQAPSAVSDGGGALRL